MPAARIAYRLAHGLCAQCGEPARPNRRMCQRCADMHLKRNRKWRQKQRAKGRCVMCGGALARGSVQYCPFHLRANATERAKTTQKHIDEGLCVECGKPLPEDRKGLLTCGCDEIRRMARWS